VPDLKTRSRLILAVALLVPAVASVWLIAQPQTMTASTYAIGAILLVALAAGALVSGVRNDQLRTHRTGLKLVVNK